MAHPFVERPATVGLPDTEPDNGLRDYSLVLGDDQLKEIARFQEDICHYETDTDKYRLCTRTRDDLLRKHADLQLLIAVYKHVMLSEYMAYRTFKENSILTTNQKDDETEE
jgi:hypothetical protein